MAELCDDTRLMWNPRVASRDVDGTAFILLDSRISNLNEVGSAIWSRCREGATLAELVEAVVLEYETDLETAARDVRRFVAELCDKNMLIPKT